MFIYHFQHQPLGTRYNVNDHDQGHRDYRGILHVPSGPLNRLCFGKLSYRMSLTLHLRQ